MTSRVALVLAVLVLSSAVRPKLPAESLFGITLGMQENAVRQKLLQIATPSTSPERPKQSWVLKKDRRYGYLAVRYDTDWRVKWVTAFARSKGPRVRYRDIGDLGQARRAGFYIYTWSVSPRSGRAGYTITARGTHPDHLSSLSLSSHHAAVTPASRASAPDTTLRRDSGAP